MASVDGSPARPRPVDELVERLRKGGPAVVALSGGVDSAVVAALAVEALGTSASALTLAGSAVSAREVERARELARAVGIEHQVVEADPLGVAAYRANGADRCYHCRTVEAGAIRAHVAGRPVRQLLDGIHVDDLGDERPGIRAMDEAGFFHVLLWAGWSKNEVRAEARRRALPNWDRPSDACLASRVARGRPISAELLRRVDAAEQVVLARGFRRVRVRVDGRSARIEVDPAEVDRFGDLPLLTEVVAEIGALGFDPVTVDPRGYRGAPLPVVR
jgi:uncharacterized protein